jgi:hypothetical protein
MSVRFRMILVLLSISLLLLAAGCNLRTLEVGNVQVLSESVEVGAAESVTADIAIGAGRLTMVGGGTSLLDADFTYNVEAWEPTMEYRVSGDRGRLTVEQPSVREGIPIDLDNIRYEWELRFSDEVPLDLEISMGAGEGDLDLSSLTLNRVNFESGAGDVNVDLSGSSLNDLSVRIGAGDVTVDLSGDWQNDLSADIQGGLGRVTVVLPRSTGVEVEAQGGIGLVNATGFNQSGNTYTNDAFGESEATLFLNIEGGVGEINLELAG